MSDLGIVAVSDPSRLTVAGSAAKCAKHLGKLLRFRPKSPFSGSACFSNHSPRFPRTSLRLNQGILFGDGCVGLPTTTARLAAFGADPIHHEDVSLPAPISYCNLYISNSNIPSGAHTIAHSRGALMTGATFTQGGGGSVGHYPLSRGEKAKLDY